MAQITPHEALGDPNTVILMRNDLSLAAISSFHQFCDKNFGKNCFMRTTSDDGWLEIMREEP